MLTFLLDGLMNLLFALLWLFEAVMVEEPSASLYHLKMQEKKTVNWDIWLLHLLREFPATTDWDRFVSCTYAEFFW